MHLGALLYKIKNFKRYIAKIFFISYNPGVFIFQPSKHIGGHGKYGHSGQAVGHSEWRGSIHVNRTLTMLIIPSSVFRFHQPIPGEPIVCICLCLYFYLYYKIGSKLYSDF